MRFVSVFFYLKEKINLLLQLTVVLLPRTLLRVNYSDIKKGHLQVRLPIKKDTLKQQKVVRSFLMK